MASIETSQVVTAADYKPSDATPSQVVTTEKLEQASPVTVEATAAKILKIIEQYGLNYERTGSWDGFETFFPIVLGQVSRGESIKMLLPGFPFKSPNSRDKVLGNLPDLGEELALKHLNGLCENIKMAYGYGAEVHITSDGLVYNDLLGVPDEDVWNFGEAVRQITVKHSLHHLSFLRLWDLLGTPGTWSKEHYLTNASSIRQELMERYGDPQFDADMANKSSDDMQMTHTKYLEFLKSDLLLNKNWLAQSQEEQAITISDTAKAMMSRWKAFAAALSANRTDYVRLSIHDSGGKDKLSMALIPQKQRGALGATPWHSVVVAELDGSYRSVQRHTIDQEKYELIHSNGRPYFFRAKSPLFDWGTDCCHVQFEHLYPTGLIIRPTTEATSITTIPMRKVRALSNTFSPIVLRGFVGATDRDTYLMTALGFGEVIRDEYNADITPDDEAKVEIRPGYALIGCGTAPPQGSGSMLFTSSRLCVRYLPSPWSTEDLEAGAKEKSCLITRHPTTSEPCIHWQELNAVDNSVNGDEGLIGMINKHIYDWRLCLRLSWVKDDLLAIDHTATLRLMVRRETDDDRQLWRITLN